MRPLARRVLSAVEDTDHIDTVLTHLVTATAPGLLELYGVGIDTASCWSPPATTPTGCIPKRPGRTCVG
ncbi:MAG: hypothetical protein ACRDZS_14600 [Acidimicrobiales bacterium]